MKNITKFALAALLTTVAATGVDAAGGFDFGALAQGVLNGKVAPPRPAAAAGRPAGLGRAAPGGAGALVGDPVAKLQADGKIAVDLNAPAADTYIITNTARNLLNDAVRAVSVAKDGLVKDASVLAQDPVTKAFSFTVNPGQTLIKKADADVAVQAVTPLLIKSGYTTCAQQIKAHFEGIPESAPGAGDDVESAAQLLLNLKAMPLTTQAEIELFIDALAWSEATTPLTFLLKNVVPSLKAAVGDKADAANPGNKAVDVTAVFGADLDHLTGLDSTGAPSVKTLNEWFLDGLMR